MKINRIFQQVKIHAWFTERSALVMDEGNFNSDEYDLKVSAMEHAKKTNRKIWITIVIIVALIIIFIPIRNISKHYKEMKRNFESGYFSSAEYELEKIPVILGKTQEYKKKLAQIEVTYQSGVDAINEGDLDKAINSFSQLPDTASQKKQLTDRSYMDKICLLVNKQEAWEATDGYGGSYRSVFYLEEFNYGIYLYNQEQEYYDGESGEFYLDSASLRDKNVLEFDCRNRDSFTIDIKNITPKSVLRTTEAGIRVTYKNTAN